MIEAHLPIFICKSKALAISHTPRRVEVKAIQKELAILLLPRSCSWKKSILREVSFETDGESR